LGVTIIQHIRRDLRIAEKWTHRSRN